MNMSMLGMRRLRRQLLLSVGVLVPRARCLSSGPRGAAQKWHGHPQLLRRVRIVGSQGRPTRVDGS